MPLSAMKRAAGGAERSDFILQSCAEKEPEMYVALYADESVPYREIVRVLNIANENHLRWCWLPARLKINKKQWTEEKG